MGAVFVGTRSTAAWVVTDRDRVTDEVKHFAPSIDFKVPNGPCFSKALSDRGIDDLAACYESLNPGAAE